MTKARRRPLLIISALLVAIMLTSLLSTAVFAGTANKAMLYNNKIESIRTDNYEKIPIKANGKELAAYLINENTYAPVRAFYNATTGAKVSYSSLSRTVTVKDKNLSVTLKDGCDYIIANGRYLWCQSPVVILDDGRMYVPVRTLAKTVGLPVLWDNSERKVSISGKASYIESASSFYDSDEVYWLSKIISAEAKGESLLGKIAVGNVILNRVESKLYPNTIYGVIFDRKYGTQFSPVSFGTIYNKATSDSVIASKICLEGTTLSEDILFFYNPRIATTSWIDRAREHAFTIGNHKFYY